MLECASVMVYVFRLEMRDVTPFIYSPNFVARRSIFSIYRLLPITQVSNDLILLFEGVPHKEGEIRDLASKQFDL